MSGSHGVAAVAGPEGTKAGLRAIRISAAVLAVAAAAPLAVVVFGGRAGLIADGKHARIDALASIAAFLGLLGVQLGWRAADPLAGLLITIAIVAIAWDASGHVLARVMDAVDPKIVSLIEHAARETPGVLGIGRVQARWVGRSLHVALTVAVDGNVSVANAHAIAETVHHHIIHDLPGV